jgi:hypothetical protein
MTREEADREAKIRLDGYKSDHFERMCEDSRELSEWTERSQLRDSKHWRETEFSRGQLPTGSDGATSLTGINMNLPKPTDEELTTQISVLEMSNKESNCEPHGLTQFAKKRHIDDNDDTDDAVASGSKRARVAYH